MRDTSGIVNSIRRGLRQSEQSQNLAQGTASGLADDVLAAGRAHMHLRVARCTKIGSSVRVQAICRIERITVSAELHVTRFARRPLTRQ